MRLNAPSLFNKYCNSHTTVVPLCWIRVISVHSRVWRRRTTEENIVLSLVIPPFLSPSLSLLCVDDLRMRLFLVQLLWYLYSVLIFLTISSEVSILDTHAQHTPEPDPL